MITLIFEMLTTIAEIGCIYSLVVLAVFITSRIIKFDDLTVDGSFATGGAVTAFLAQAHIWPSFLLPLAFVSGIAVGAITGLLHAKLKINNLMSGIIVTTGIFSLNLKLAGPNLSLAGLATIFTLPEYLLRAWSHMIVLAMITALIFGIISWLLHTELGFLLRAVGGSPQMLINLGKNVAWYRIGALMLANGLTALAGSLFVQHTGFFSITGSIGTLIIGLAGLIIAESMPRKSLIMLIFGAIAYQAIIACTIELQLDPAWNKLITACLIILMLVIRQSSGAKEEITR